MMEMDMEAVARGWWQPLQVHSPCGCVSAGFPFNERSR